MGDLDLPAGLSDFGRFLIQTRLQRLKTVREFASLCGVSPATISRLELHGDLPKVDIIFKISQALEMSPIEVLNQAYPEQMADLVVLARIYHDLPAECRRMLLDQAEHLARA